MNPLVVSILSSTVISAIISGGVTFYFKGLDFKNEYYKRIIDKRFESYSKIERVVTLLQIKSGDTINEGLYHWIFTDWQSLNEFKEALQSAIFNGMWISSQALNIILEMDMMLKQFEIEYPFEEHNGTVMAGKNYFVDMEALSKKLERRCKHDLLRSHKLEIFKPRNTST
jgi:hypothetical protein